MRIALSLLAVMITPLVSGAGQQATFLGIVTDSTTGTPLSGATVSFVEAALADITDDVGGFQVSGIGSGIHTILVRAVGFEPWGMRLQIDVEAGMEVEIGNINLVPSSYELDPIEVEGEAYKLSPGFSGFQHRMRTEDGTFVTIEEIRRLAPQKTSDILKRVPGFRTLEGGTVTSTRGIPSLRQGFDLCATEFYIDGVHSGMDTVDDIMPSSIAGMEIYSGSSTIPATFRGPGNALCGVVAIWTTDGIRGR